ncbi:MAG: glycerophosphodiester phosphodiesterase [Myxococcaceae bacterium]
MKVWAHRGASADAPENTLMAFAEAVRQGADGVELDAMVCGSGEVVVCHDEHLGRLAGVDRHVRDMSAQALRESRAAVPTLEAVLGALPGHFEINIELKSDGWNDRGLARRLAEMLRDRQLASRVIVSSFNPIVLRRFERFAPEVRLGWLIDPDKPYWLHGTLLTKCLARFSVHPPDSACTEKRLRSWKQRGWAIVVWTVDSPERAQWLAARGVEYCITNRPGLIRDALVSQPG